MRTNLKEVKDAIWDNLIYYCASSTSDEFISSAVKPYFDITEEQEEVICDTISICCRDWRKAPCDPEGATAEQDTNMDSIIDATVEELISLLIKE